MRSKVASTRNLRSKGSTSRESRVGVARVDITPDRALPMAGYSGAGQLGVRGRDRLYARAFYFEDPHGAPLAICALDLWCASSFLVAAVAERLSKEGVGADRLVLVGTHTHSAPGNYLGNAFYDALGSDKPGFDRKWAHGLAGMTANAIKEARASARPARLAWGTSDLWSMSRNRSLPAFEAAQSPLDWVSPGELGERAPADASPQQKAIDPRVSTLTITDHAGAIQGVLALFGCHATALGIDFGTFSRDWPGYAVDDTERRLKDEGHFGAVVALVPSAAGDVTPLPPDDRRGTWQGPDHGSRNPNHAQGRGLAQWMGRALGETMAARALADAPTAKGFTVDGRFRPWVPLETADAEAPIESWSIGWPVLGGAEDARTGWRHLRIREGMPSDHYLGPGRDAWQHPKSPVGSGAQRWLWRFLELLKPSAWHALHVVRVGPMVLATVPGEPTTVMARRTERALAAITGTEVRVVGFAGDYAGYFTTEEEYALQHYEGAHTLYGRKSALHLQRRLCELATAMQQGARVDLPSQLACHSISASLCRLLWWRLTRHEEKVELETAGQPTVARVARKPPDDEAVPVLGRGFGGKLPRHRNLYLYDP